MICPLNAQYFGQNKPSYKQFNFELYQTPNFDIYHYFTSDSLVNKLAQQSEVWYRFHQQLLLDTFNVRNPLLVYSNHADFQQTNAIHGAIDPATGGVTEGLKKRIVMPVSFSAQQTNHVLGHEMVHAFQYDIIQKHTYAGLGSIQNIPLWMIEGMAEYLSVGNFDSHTILWMRDALIQDKFPTLEEMSSSYHYSPYRYGQAFWSYIANTYGEQYIHHLFIETANKGLEKALNDVLRVTTDSLSVAWKNALESHLLKGINLNTFMVHGDRIVTKKNGGSYNLAPSISPDGEKIIFLSERDLFGLDLFLANAKTGEILKKVYTSTYSDQIDALNYIETAGTWSNDSRYFAYVAYLKGESAIVIFDIEKGKIHNEIAFKGLDAISYPAWSPDGEKIAFSGLQEGISDLYIYQFSDGKIVNLSNDNFCNLQSTWSSDGNLLFYVTDEPSQTQERYFNDFFNIASLHVQSGQKKVYTTFDGASNVNPAVNEDASKLYFLSDRDGTRNMYVYHTEEDEVSQLTHYPTGITGITPLSPALAIGKSNLFYTMLWEGEFTILRSNIHQIEKTAKPVVDRKNKYRASRIMPYSKFPSRVDENLAYNQLKIPSLKDDFSYVSFKSKFKLDYIGNTGVGIVTSRFGTGMGGSVEARFSDILGEHLLYTGVNINGEIYDFGGQVAYVNQKRPVKLGVSVSHIPYRTGYYIYYEDPQTEEGYISYIFRRTFVDKLSLFGFYPLNKAHRIEAGVSASHFSYRTEQYNGSNQFYSSGKNREVIDSPSPFDVGVIDVAYVIDNSKFGIAAPIEGKRIRLGYERYLSGVEMNAYLLDFRRYINVKPYSFAFRMYHYGRYGKGSDSDRLMDLFIGYPWYVRGYESGGFYGNEEEGKVSLNQFLGSRIVVSNFEVRIPFTGPRNYAILPSKAIFSNLALFYDAGIAWDSQSKPQLSFITKSISERIPIMSTGVGLRVNILGAIIIEPYYAYPIYQKQIHKGNFGINVLAGW
jgi:Tol biopolymer transport system component